MNTELKLTLGGRLKCLRMALGYSPNELAAKSGLSRMTIVRAEAGESDLRLGTLQAMLGGLHVERAAWGRFMLSEASDDQ